MFKKRYKDFYSKIEVEQNVIDSIKKGMQEERESKKVIGMDRVLPLALAASLLVVFITFDNMYVQNINDGKVYIEEADDNINKEDYEVINKDISEEDIHTNEVFSNVVPTKYISGYKFESGTYYEKRNGKKGINFSYRKGYGYIQIIISEKVDVPDYNNRFVKMEQIDKYDISKYSIPFADSVPEELRDTIHNPIFLPNEISKDVLEKRVVKLQESGESKKQNMEFSIDYEGLIVRYIISYYNKENFVENVYELVKSTPYFNKI